MKKLVFCLGVTIAIALGTFVFSVNNNVSAQSYNTTPNTFGGGTTTRGSNGSTFRTTPNTFGGGYNTRRQ